LIDIGQAEGAFTQGLGFFFLEKIKYDKENGQSISHGTWDYFPPLRKDIPIDFRVSFLENSPNPNGILGAKAIGEPPLVLSLSAYFACKRAIEAARLETGVCEPFGLSSPITSETIQLLCLTNSSHFRL
jgi:xanthine dehydrogenase/oxidase